MSERRDQPLSARREPAGPPDERAPLAGRSRRAEQDWVVDEDILKTESAAGVGAPSDIELGSDPRVNRDVGRLLMALLSIALAAVLIGLIRSIARGGPGPATSSTGPLGPPRLLEPSVGAPRTAEGSAATRVMPVAPPRAAAEGLPLTGPRPSQTPATARPTVQRPAYQPPPAVDRTR